MRGSKHSDRYRLTVTLCSGGEYGCHCFEGRIILGPRGGKMDRTDSRKITTVVLMAYFPDNLDKPVPDCLTILDFAAAREDEAGDGASQNSSDVQSSSQITATTHLARCPFCRPTNS